MLDGKKSFWGGLVIQHGSDTIYYSGDTNYGPHFAEIAKRFPDLDIAFIEIGQYGRRWPDDHMFPDETGRAAADVKARRVVPVHWGAYSMAYHPWAAPFRQSVLAMRELGVNPATPLQGQMFDVETATSEWCLNIQP